MFEIWNCFGKIIDSILLVCIPTCIFPEKKIIRHKWRLFALSSFAISMILYGIDMFFKPVELFLTLILYITVGLLYVCFFFQGRFYLKMIVQSTTVCCTMLMHFIVVASLSLLTGSLMLFTWQQMLSEIIFSVLLAYSLIRFSKIPQIDLPSRYGICMAALMLTLALLSDVPMMVGSDSFFTLGLNVFMLIIILFLYFLFFSMIREYEEKKFLAQQINLQKKHLEESSETYESMIRLRHELKNHAFYMKTLLVQKEYDQLKAYFERVYEHEHSIDVIESGNRIINALLNQKNALAKSKGIQVDYSIALPDTLCVDESHVCAIISNLFDNAVEACESLPNPKIYLVLQQKENFLHITCKNTVPFDILKENSSLQTTKEQSSYHGIGLQVIKSIADMYEGMTDFYMEDGLVFVASVMLESSDQTQKAQV